MIKKITMFLCCLFLLTTFSVRGDQWDKKTVVTFGQPVELPGMALAAGTYVFKLANVEGNRHVVMVYNENEDHFYGFIMAIPNYRLKPTGDPVLTFSERPAGTPMAIRAWFWPGDNFGQEFVYPKAKAAVLAKETERPVLTAEVTPTMPPEELKEAPITAITPETKEEPLAEWIESEKPFEVPLEIAATRPAERLEVEPVAELPKTSSPIPLLGLAGFGLIGLAGVVRLLAKATA